MNKESLETKSPLFSVDFWFKIVGAAILLALSIWGLLDFDGIGKVLVVFVCALFIIMFEMIQVVPAFKVIKNGKARAFLILEIIVDLAIGVFVFYAGVIYARFNGKNPEGWNDFVVNLIGDKQIHIILTGVVLYIRGINYFIASVLFKEPTKAKIFWTQVLFMTFGVVCISSSSNLNTAFTWIIIILALLSGLYIGGSGGVSFLRYKKYMSEKHEVEKADEVSKDAPTRPGTQEEVYDEEDISEVYDEPVDVENPSKGKKKQKKGKKKNKISKEDAPEPEVILPEDDTNHPYVN